MFLSDPKQFDILIIISCVACIGSCILYLGWYVKTGGLQEKQEDSDEQKNADKQKETDVSFDKIEGKENPSAPVEDNVIFENPAVTSDATSEGKVNNGDTVSDQEPSV